MCQGQMSFGEVSSSCDRVGPDDDAFANAAGFHSVQVPDHSSNVAEEDDAEPG